MAFHDPFEADMQKRLLIAMVLSMVVLFWLVPALSPPPPPEGELGPGEEIAQPQGELPLALEDPSFLAPSLTPQAPPTQATSRIIEVENDSLLMRWSSAGATLRSARLKEHWAGEEGLVEIIPQRYSDGLSQPLSIRVGDRQLDERLARAVYEVEGAFQMKLQAPAKLRFHYRDDRIEISRTISVPASGYLVEMETEVRLDGRIIPFRIVLGPGVGEPHSPSSVDFAQPKVAYYQDGAVTRYTAGDLEDSPAHIQGPARWVALDSQYFCYLVLSPEGVRSIRITKTDAVSEAADGESESQALVGAEVELEPGAPHAVFIGPKDYEILSQAEPTLNQLIDYGWFGFLVKPLLLTLRFIYGYVHNYGWAIIILTFFINLALSPVRYKQTLSMKKMAQLQPQMKGIQAKYKNMKRDDPRRQKMNEEVMAMYKAHGVNPLGGCLPLLIQMPFLFAFYQMLFSSIELRGAPFIFWIQDLSQPDPYYITPIVMGVSMVAQQQMTPATGDPAQRRIMMLMPVVFTFFFLNFSSGLVVYFLFSNLFGMMFQFLMQRWAPEIAAPVPEKKAEKKK